MQPHTGAGSAADLGTPMNCMVRYETAFVHGQHTPQPIPAGQSPGNCFGFNLTLASPDDIWAAAFASHATERRWRSRPCTAIMTCTCLMDISPLALSPDQHQRCCCSRQQALQLPHPKTHEGLQLQPDGQNGNHLESCDRGRATCHLPK